MSEPFIGEIRMFAGNFAPEYWAFCDGSLMPISNNPSLYSILGTTWGGDGRTTFGLPDLRGRVPLGFGTGPGLTPRQLGERHGYEAIPLDISQLPTHKHDIESNNSTEGSGNVKVHQGVGDTDDPTVAKSLASQVPAGRDTANLLSTEDATTVIPSAVTGIQAAIPSQTNNTGAGQPHMNMQPYLAVNYIIALQGIYPPRS